MSERAPGLFSKLTRRLAVSRWARTARRAKHLDLSHLRHERMSARRLRSHLDHLIHVADERLHYPQVGNAAMRLPHNTDWAWRPALWRGQLPKPGLAAVQTGARFGPEIAVFHDCAVSELTLRQVRNTRSEDLALYGLCLDVFRFDGAYLSLVVDLPAEAAQGLTKSHLVRVESIVETEKPMAFFARLNVQNGPNTEQVVREIPASQGDVAVEFDLAYTKLNEKRIDKLWLDLIFDGPEMNQVFLRDLTVSRRPRAEL